MSNAVADKIRILLIDDQPAGLWNERERSLPQHPAVTDIASESPALKRSQLFDLRWLATAGEAREYIDLTRLISRHNPLALAKEGWIPEIVVIDYSLTQNPVTVERRLEGNRPLLEKLSPLESLRELAKKLGLPLPHKGEEYSRPVNQDSENYGCFIGGLVLTCLSDHPCAPVTVTVRAQAQIGGSHTGFFEWLLTTESSGKLQAAGRMSVGWKEITNWGMERLRQRIEQLDDANLITLSLTDLLDLSEGNSKGLTALHVRSRYGLRRFPVNALFIDLPEGDKAKEMTKWAQGRLEALLKRASPNATLTQSKEEIRQGKNLAKTLWDIYSSDVFLRRQRLSKLAEKATNGGLSEQEGLDFKSDCEFFGVSKRDGKTEVCTRNIYTLKDTGEGMSGRSLRWTVLFLTLNLCKRKAAAHENFQSHTGLRGNIDGLFGDLTVEDVFLALYPSSGDEPHIAKSLSTTNARPLTRLKDDDRPPSLNDPNNFGNLGLKIGDVLEGKPWREDADVAKGQWTYGLIAGEKFILRGYALDNGLAKSDRSPFLESIFG